MDPCTPKARLAVAEFVALYGYSVGAKTFGFRTEILRRIVAGLPMSPQSQTTLEDALFNHQYKGKQ